MTDHLNCSWLYIEGDLPDWLASGYEEVGFTRAGIAWAVQQRYQLENADRVMVSIFPIEDMERFQATAGQLLAQQGAAAAAAAEDTALPPWHRVSATNCRVITQEECDAIHTRLLALDARRREETAVTPTEEDVFRAEQLLLLTELCNGVAELKNGQKTGN